MERHDGYPCYRTAAVGDTAEPDSHLPGGQGIATSRTFRGTTVESPLSQWADNRMTPLRTMRRRLTYDVAIYGAGPAGISLALALSGSGLHIGLFEAGGVDPPVVGLDHPYQGANLGRPYNLANTRLRYLGGTSNHWGGYCRPLDELDFAVRPYIPLSGWPIDRESLNPYLQAALEVCEVPSGGLGLAAFEHDFGYRDFIHHDHPAFQVKNLLFSPPTRFGERYRQDLEDAEDIECGLYATLVLLIAVDGAIDGALLASSDGSKHQVQADYHVLAMGAVENARILLHSRLANSSDFVGRCFSDHMGMKVGSALLSFSNRYFPHIVSIGDRRLRVLPHLSLSNEAQEKYELPNTALVMRPKGNPSLDVYGAGIKRQLDGLLNSTTRYYSVTAKLEHTPNTQSRITLTNQVDGYGVPRVALNWRVNAFDVQSMMRLADILGPLVGEAGGRMNTIDYQIAEGEHPPGVYQAHQMGTTRMSYEADGGVVNADLRSHDLANLYLAGSSVFPTFGFANPTLTIVALSLRLAEHLRQKAGSDRA